jgi:hypothetical protein
MTPPALGTTDGAGKVSCASCTARADGLIEDSSCTDADNIVMSERRNQGLDRLCAVP